MTETTELDPFKLPRPPIMEAVLDIDCDLPPNLDFGEVEKQALEAFGERYPIQRKQFVHEASLRMDSDCPSEFSASQGLAALQFVTADEKEVVQIRVGGFSYNRMEPYTSFDDYLPEISRCWDEFRRLAAPVQIRKIGLRFINRIPIPTENGVVNLSEYLKVSPNLPDGTGLQFAGFFHQHQAADPSTGINANIILASQPAEPDTFPLLLDIEVFRLQRFPPAPLADWADQIKTLRTLKNRIFEHSLTTKCLNLFH
ncbi:MAG: TIGR04255 family protein [Verrucomicrobiaceae bacterium]|nr:MAG: TIGR04255 family protein [Verrucomicrobiaceae bacterium]